MNFLEARQAALEGKTVRMVGHYSPKGITPESMLSCRAWMTESIEADWEIVEESGMVVQYVNLYLRSPGELSFGESHITRELALGVRHQDSIGMIEIVTDRGRLVSARNV
jgi:hypothetical protein